MAKRVRLSTSELSRKLVNVIINCTPKKPGEFSAFNQSKISEVTKSNSMSTSGSRPIVIPEEDWSRPAGTEIKEEKRARKPSTILFRDVNEDGEITIDEKKRVIYL